MSNKVIIAENFEVMNLELSVYASTVLMLEQSNDCISLTPYKTAQLVKYIAENFDDLPGIDMTKLRESLLV